MNTLKTTPDWQTIGEKLAADLSAELPPRAVWEVLRLTHALGTAAAQPQWQARARWLFAELHLDGGGEFPPGAAMIVLNAALKVAKRNKRQHGGVPD